MGTILLAYLHSITEPFSHKHFNSIENDLNAPERSPELQSAGESFDYKSHTSVSVSVSAYPFGQAPHSAQSLSFVSQRSIAGQWREMFTKEGARRRQSGVG